jgi:3-oxoacyl-[acyl-carrier-protein] synthase III
LFSVAAAVLGICQGEAYPLVSTSAGDHTGLDLVRDAVRTGEYRTVLVAGGTENGNNAALVLRSPELSEGLV